VELVRIARKRGGGGVVVGVLLLIGVGGRCFFLSVGVLFAKGALCYGADWGFHFILKTLVYIKFIYFLASQPRLHANERSYLLAFTGSSHIVAHIP